LVAVTVLLLTLLVETVLAHQAAVLAVVQVVI
jgi:hypothetical protein